MGVADYRLNPDGPHSDDYTRHAAQAMAEAVRVLNHATRHPDGVTAPNTVHDVLSNMQDAVTRLDQLIEQLYKRLNGMYAAGRLNDDSGYPVRQLQAALKALVAAREPGRLLAMQLDQAHQATSGMYANEPWTPMDGGDA